jgi:dihydrofolate synthase/folylpolyglutamate synthase
VLSAAQPPAVTNVIEETCRQQGANLHWVEPLPDDWQLGLAGEMQRNNAAVARAALQALAPLGWTVEESAIRRGFEEAHWPGRMQTARWQSHPVLLDGAHNPPAASQLAMERRRWTAEEAGVCWILAMQAHKQAPAMLEHLLQPPDRAWIVPVPEHRSWTHSQLAEQCPQWRNQLLQADSGEAALLEIERLGTWPRPMPVVAGSLYLLGDLFARAVVTAE